MSSRCACAQEQRNVDRLKGRWKHQAKTGQPFSYPPLIWHAVSDRDGDWGWIEPHLTYGRRGAITWKAVFSVQEVLSETEAIVEVLITQYTAQMIQGFGELNSESGHARHRFLFREFDFRGIKENEPFEWRGGVVVSGKHSVERADGSKVELIGIETTMLPPLPKHAAELGIGLRTWHDDTGKHSIRAGFGSINRDKVILVKPDGDRIEVPVDRLSKADQREIEKLTVVRPEPLAIARRSAPNRSTTRRSRPRQSFSDGLHNLAINAAQTSIQRDLNASFRNMRAKSNNVQWILNSVKSNIENARQLRLNAPRTNR